MVSKKQKQKAKQPKLKRWVKFWLIPIALVAFWLALSLWHVNTNAGITVLVYPHSVEDTVDWEADELLAGEKATGEFVARDNNLGIVAVRFNTFFRINEDIVRFRIKEEGSDRWYYENDYTTPQFQPNDLFTFGFPIIENSQGKTYVFEVESLEGEPEDAVALSPIEPVYVTKYQYSKELITTDTDYALTFLTKKTLNSVTNLDFLLASFAYALPLMMYIIWLLFFDKYLSDKYYIVFIPLIFMGMGAVAFMDTTRNDAFVLGLTLLWFFTALAYKLRSTVSLSVSLVLISISAVLYYVDSGSLSRNITMWGYLLMVVGVIQAIIELKIYNKNLLGISEFAEKLGIKR